MDKVQPESIKSVEETFEEENEFQVSPEEMLVIDFINELQLKFEVDAHEQISKQVKDKFGDLGTKVLSQLNTEVSSDDNSVEECTDCGKVSEEWLKKSQEKLKNVEIFLDDETDELAQQIIDDFAGDDIKTSIIQENIAKYDGCDITDVTSEQIELIQKKILFMGIVDGWLIDEIFVKE